MVKGPANGPRPLASGELWLTLQLEAELIELGDIVDVWAPVGANLKTAPSTTRVEIFDELGEGGKDLAVFTVKLTQDEVITHKGGTRFKANSNYMTMLSNVEDMFKGELRSASVGTKRFDTSPEKPDRVFTNKEISEEGRFRFKDMWERQMRRFSEWG